MFKKLGKLGFGITMGLGLGLGMNSDRYYIKGYYE